MNLVIQQLDRSDRVLVRRFVSNAEGITPDELYRHAFGHAYEPREPMMVDGGRGAVKPSRSIAYWIGRYTLFKWRAAVAAADGEIEVVERRLRKQGFPQRIRNLILKGHL